jgi:hypothetical protein
VRESRVPPSPIKLKIHAALQFVGPMDCGELALHIGTTREVIAQYVRQMRTLGVTIRISGWAYPEGVGRAAPIYDVGLLPDVPKPPRQSVQEQKRKRYAKNRAVVRIQQSGKKSALYRLNNILGL